MNTNDHDTRFNPDDAEERRWQAQERARRGDVDADAADLRIARALRQAPPVDLPPDFAVRTAALARTQVTASILFEQRLLRVLVSAFVLSAISVLAWFGRGLVAALTELLPGGADAVGWSALAAFCLLGNWGLGLLRQFGWTNRHAAT